MFASHAIVKFKKKSFGPNYTNFVFFEKTKLNKTKNKKKKDIFKTIFDKALTPFWKTFL